MYKSDKLKLIVLTENLAGKNFLAEHGLSYFIEVDNEKILFDTGHSDVFLKNATVLGLDVQNSVDKVVLSHGHWDHGNGLSFLNDKTLITHPGSFIRRFRKTDHSSMGLSFTLEELKNKFNIIETDEPYQLSEKIFFLGEIPGINDFEGKSTSFVDENDNEDFVPDDSALAIIENNELIIVTGCSHSGICNICEYAKTVTKIPKLKVVIGGFHLTKRNRQTQKTIEYFRKNNVERLLPSHCTGLPALTAFYNEFNCEPVKTGMAFEF